MGDNEVEVEIEEEKLPVERHTWEFLKYELDPETHALVQQMYARFTQFPVKLAWALTVHKSHGKTLDSLYLNLDADLFERGQLYVGFCIL